MKDIKEKYEPDRVYNDEEFQKIVDLANSYNIDGEKEKREGFRNLKLIHRAYNEKKFQQAQA